MFYTFIFLGTMLEGELFLTLGVYFAMKGAHSLPGLMVAAGFGAFTGDLICLYLGRHFGARWMGSLAKRLPRIGHMAEQVGSAVTRHPMIYILILRFQIMMRTLGFITLGKTRGRERGLIPMMLFSAAVWSVGLTLFLKPVLFLLVRLFQEVWAAF